MKTKNIFVLIIFLMVGIISACVSIQPTQTNVPTDTFYPTSTKPTQTIESVTEQEEDPPVHLIIGETSTIDGLSINVDNLTFEPGCGGLLGFEMKFQNDSGLDQVVYLHLGGGFNNPSLRYVEGYSTQECYQDDFSGKDGEFLVNDGESVTYAVRIIDEIDPRESQFGIMFYTGSRDLGLWFIDKKSVAVRETDTPQPRKTCEADKWKIIPLSLETYPSSQQQGWKYLLVKLAVANYSNIWGELADSGISWFNAQLITDGGFSYSPVSSSEYWQEEKLSKLHISENLVGWTSDPIPPGFAIRGILNEADKQVAEFSLVYKIAATQNPITLTTTGLHVICKDLDGNTVYADIQNPGPNLVIDLQKDIRILSNPISKSSVRNVSDPIEIPNLGKIHIVGLTNSTDLPGMMLNMEFANASQGYQAEGGIDSYLITSDGIVIRDEGGFSAGPGLSVKFSLLFENAPFREDYFFVVYRRTLDINPDIPINAIYQLAEVTTSVVGTISPTPTSESNKIALGTAHTCAITKNGGVKCWGENKDGQLGDGTTINRPSPVDVSGLSNGAIAISAGSAYTCVLMSEGYAKCWGRNEFGQLGDGTTTNRLEPTDVVGINSKIVAIATGNDHTCVLTSEGGVKCWGINSFGQLGDGTTDQHLTPVDVYGLSNDVSILAAGAQHSCAFVNSGKVKCWGGVNKFGEIGDGTTIERLTPVDVSDLNSNVIALTLGQFHTCALTSEGEVKCWGDNRYGQLGDGTTTTQITPVNVSELNSGVASIGSGRFHNCVISNGVKCWGWNKEGQLGDNTTINHSTPVNVIGLNGDVTALAVGGHHTCVLINTGGIKCWGWNFSGQLGNDLMADSNNPVDVYSNTPVDVIGSAEWFP